MLLRCLEKGKGKNFGNFVNRVYLNLKFLIDKGKFMAFITNQWLKHSFQDRGHTLLKLMLKVT